MTRRAGILALALAAAAPGQPPLRREPGQWERELKGAVPTGGASRLKITSPGRLTIRPSASRDGSISYQWVFRAAASSGEAARFLLDQARVQVRTANGWCALAALGSGFERSELTVNVPADLEQYIFEAAAGGVSVRGLNGDILAASGAGSIDMDEIRGNVTARTGGGAMTFGRVSGALRCLSGGGAIRAARAGGEAVLESAGGEIWLDEAGGPVRASTAGNIHIGQAGGPVSAHTAGGLIEVGRAGGAVTAETASGNIIIGPAPGVHAEAANGAIRMHGVSGVIRAATASGAIVLALGADQPLGNSFLSSGRGDITVVAPPKLSMTVKALNESGSYYSRFVSEFPEVRAQQPASPGVRRAVLAEGAINGGGPVLIISAGNGSVYLKRAR